MKMTTLGIALIGSVFSISAMADGHDGRDHANRYSWDNWVQMASAAPRAPEASDAFEARHGAISLVPAGTANYAGSTVALVRDSSSGTTVPSVSTGSVNLAVTFDGTGSTTETGTITGLTGAGSAIGDLAFTGAGVNDHFHGTVTSTTYPSVAATATTPATGTGMIRGELSHPVVVTPAVPATATTPAVPPVVSAPLSAHGSWGFVATPTLRINGAFVATKQ